MSGNVDISLHTVGVPEVDLALDALLRRIDVASVVATDYAAAAMVQQAKINATGERRGPGGRPYGSDPGTGPGNVTGRLRASIGVKSRQRGAFSYRVTVGAEGPQVRRLELGFHGRDRLGRFYRQPKYPFMSTAHRFVVEHVVPGLFETATAAAIEGGRAA